MLTKGLMAGGGACTLNTFEKFSPDPYFHISNYVPDYRSTETGFFSFDCNRIYDGLRAPKPKLSIQFCQN